jgi:hypothetical protein
MLFRAMGMTQVDLLWNIVFTALLTLGVALGTRGGALGVAVAVALVHLGFQPVYLLLGRRMLWRQVHASTS